MRNYQKGFVPILIIAIVAIVAVAGYFLLTPKDKYTAPPSSNESSSAIQNSSDLNTAANDLDSTNTEQLDSELNLLSSDASAF